MEEEGCVPQVHNSARRTSNHKRRCRQETNELVNFRIMEEEERDRQEWNSARRTSNHKRCRQDTEELFNSRIVSGLAPLSTNFASSDDGGSTHAALERACPGALTMAELDSEIKPFCDMMNEKEEWTSENPFLLQWAGTPGESWHMAIIPRALKKKGGYNWKRMSNRDIIYERGNGKFVVVGLMNRLLYPDIDQEGNWRHTICVDTDNGMFYDSEWAKCGRSVSKWLQLDQLERFMSRIDRVYRLITCMD